MLCPSLTLEDLRGRVREAETLLRVAAQHAREAREDPSKSKHASARIQAICSEVEDLFPGMHEPAAPDAEVLAAMEQLQGGVGADAGEGAGDDAGDEDAGEPTSGWDVDYAKLGAAIENDELMSRFPEPGRSAFKRAARYLVDSHERQELLSRVVRGFEELSALTTKSVEETQRKLAMAMTLDSLATRKKD